MLISEEGIVPKNEKLDDVSYFGRDHSSDTDNDQINKFSPTKPTKTQSARKSTQIKSARNSTKIREVVIKQCTHRYRNTIVRITSWHTAPQLLHPSCDIAVPGQLRPVRHRMSRAMCRIHIYTSHGQPPTRLGDSQQAHQQGVCIGRDRSHKASPQRLAAVL